MVTHDLAPYSHSTRLHHLLGRVVAWRPDAPALTHREATLTYEQLWSLTTGFAAGLAGIGTSAGDRICIYLDKRPETVASLFGTSAAGGVFVPANPLLKPPQLRYIVDHSGARVLVTTHERLAVARDQLRECKTLEHVVVIGEGQGGAGTPGDPFTVHGWGELVTGETIEHPAAGVDNDVAAILYTSGSTGLPKGVVLSHRNLIVGAHSVSEYLGNTAADRILSVLPLSFDAGLSQLTTAFAVGAQVVLVNYLLPGEVVKLCARHRITGLTCVPPLWIQLVERPWPDEATRHLRYFANTGGRMPRATLDRLRAIFPAAAPYLMYGLTEAFRSTYLDPSQVDARPGSIGKAIPNAEIVVVGPDGSPCAPGEEGELVHRGPLVALGYWNDPEKTAERFRPAPGRPEELCVPELAVWSGDIVVSDEAGYLYFVGRHDDMIKTSGYRVSPTEVEEALYATGLVRDAIALGVDDDRLGQRIVAVVSPRDAAELDTAAVLEALRTQVPKFMVPSSIEVMDTLPRSPNGKFDRNLLRERLARES